MKILNVENGVRKMYVQAKDLFFILNSGLFIPRSIGVSILDKIGNITEMDGNQYCTFTNDADIEFLSNVDCIVNYKEYRNLEPGELSMVAKDIEVKINDLEEAYDTLTPEEQDINNDDLLKIDRLAYKKKGIDDLINYKIGEGNLSFPLAIDDDGFKFGGDFSYEMRASLDPNKLLLFKTDGSVFSDDDVVPKGFIETGIGIALMDSSEAFIAGDYTVNKYLSEDKKYLIIEFDFKEYKKELDSAEPVKEENGVRKLVKRILGKK